VHRRGFAFRTGLSVCPESAVNPGTGFGNFSCAQSDMTLELLTLIAVSIACDVFGQTFFKLGALGIGKSGTVPPSLWVAIGLVVYVVEIFVWLGVLAIAPLTVAAPIASLNYIGVMLVSRWLFSERITRRQWAGAGLVMLGVIAVALTGG
jgi:undecaprenyl phosphate-alpha-L-ara4N flippase subunit ArnE